MGQVSHIYVALAMLSSGVSKFKGYSTGCLKYCLIISGGGEGGGMKTIKSRSINISANTSWWLLLVFALV